ncbi:MAG: hypothetical protein ACYYKD_11225 [Rhodospirillales bacterium]
MTNRNRLPGGPIAAIVDVQTMWLTPLIMAALNGAERLFGFTTRQR